MGAQHIQQLLVLCGIQVLGFVFPNEVQGNDDFSGGFYLHRLQSGIKKPKSVTTFRQLILEDRP